MPLRCCHILTSTSNPLSVPGCQCEDCQTRCETNADMVNAWDVEQGQEAEAHMPGSLRALSPVLGGASGWYLKVQHCPTAVSVQLWGLGAKDVGHPLLHITHATFQHNSFLRRQTGLGSLARKWERHRHVWLLSLVDYSSTAARRQCKVRSCFASWGEPSNSLEKKNFFNPTTLVQL